MNLSQSVTLLEATKSQTAIQNGIDNTPPADVLENMKRTATKIIDPVKSRFPWATVSSFYRSPKLNKKIGGAANSQHVTGEAVDLDSPNDHANEDIFVFIKDNLVFDQLIKEYPNEKGVPSWVHASYVEHPKKNRGQILVKLKDKYIPFGEYKVGMI